MKSTTPSQQQQQYNYKVKIMGSVLPLVPKEIMISAIPLRILVKLSGVTSDQTLNALLKALSTSARLRSEV